MKRQRKNKRRIILGITGSFGSGKSTVARLLKAGSCSLIDADRIAHQVLRQRDVHKKIVSIFGQAVLGKGSLDRRRLGSLVFSSKRILKKLQEIVHPRVIGIIRDKIETSPKNIILDAPLLIEAGLGDLADKILVVKISRAKQVKRLLSKTTLSRADILRRIRAQFPLSMKVRMADFIIDNNGSLAKTKEQLVKIRRLLWKN
ncbi:MAG: dephospho-CoA kinase [Candidatus Omnitrophica bacterium]|nr:dephospho-CoA kinase [Candidatus Omnitrophota bacterium]